MMGASRAARLPPYGGLGWDARGVRLRKAAPDPSPAPPPLPAAELAPAAVATSASDSPLLRTWRHGAPAWAWPVILVLVTAVLGAHATRWVVIVWLVLVAVWLSTTLMVIALDGVRHSRTWAQIVGLVFGFAVGGLLLWQNTALPCQSHPAPSTHSTTTGTAASDARGSETSAKTGAAKVETGCLH